MSDTARLFNQKKIRAAGTEYANKEFAETINKYLAEHEEEFRKQGQAEGFSDEEITNMLNDAKMKMQVALIKMFQEEMKKMKTSVATPPL